MYFMSHAAQCKLLVKTRVYVHKPKLSLNPYKRNVLFVGHRKTVQNLIRRHTTRILIMFSTFCSQNILLEFE